MTQFAEAQITGVPAKVERGRVENNEIIKQLRPHLLVAIDMIDNDENGNAKAVLERLLRVYKTEGSK